MDKQADGVTMPEVGQIWVLEMTSRPGWKAIELVKDHEPNPTPVLILSLNEVPGVVAVARISPWGQLYESEPVYWDRVVVAKPERRERVDAEYWQSLHEHPALHAECRRETGSKCPMDLSEGPGRAGCNLHDH